MEVYNSMKLYWSEIYFNHYWKQSKYLCEPENKANNTNDTMTIDGETAEINLSNIKVDDMSLRYTR